MKRKNDEGSAPAGSLYKCERCGWEWRDSSFFAGVQADGCPKCGSNIIDTIDKASQTPSKQDEGSMVGVRETVHMILTDLHYDGVLREDASESVPAINKAEAAILKLFLDQRAAGTPPKYIHKFTIPVEKRVKRVNVSTQTYDEMEIVTKLRCECGAETER